MTTTSPRPNQRRLLLGLAAGAVVGTVLLGTVAAWGQTFNAVPAPANAGISPFGDIRASTLAAYGSAGLLLAFGLLGVVRWSCGRLALTESSYAIGIASLCVVVLGPLASTRIQPSFEERAGRDLNDPQTTAAAVSNYLAYFKPRNVECRPSASGWRCVLFSERDSARFVCSVPDAIDFKKRLPIACDLSPKKPSTPKD